jgi:hypothetical protein
MSRGKRYRYTFSRELRKSRADLEATVAKRIFSLTGN